MNLVKKNGIRRNLEDPLVNDDNGDIESPPLKNTQERSDYAPLENNRVFFHWRRNMKEWRKSSYKRVFLLLLMQFAFSSSTLSSHFSFSFFLTLLLWILVFQTFLFVIFSHTLENYGLLLFIYLLFNYLFLLLC